MISFASSLENLNFVKPYSNILWIAGSVANADAKAIQFLVMVLKFFLEILLILVLWCNWVFDNFILADEPFAKALRSFEIIYKENYFPH